MKRPFGITTIALMLGWLSIAGFMWGFLVPMEEAFGKADPVMRVLAISYGVFAFASCVGLFKGRSWVRYAIWAWMATCGLTMITFVIAFPVTNSLDGYIVILGFFVFIALIFYAVDRYVSKYLRATS